jgi:hypothetical protein
MFVCSYSMCICKRAIQYAFCTPTNPSTCNYLILFSFQLFLCFKNPSASYSSVIFFIYHFHLSNVANCKFNAYTVVRFVSHIQYVKYPRNRTDQFFFIAFSSRSFTTYGVNSRKYCRLFREYYIEFC